ncbi:hypothetical protein A0H81_00901 [Grifola frondosa]|uniref:FAM192A/Fyv6 N-terminal domain-containing protein n=1 Tax=Grifola frondosa TaxID=5627 RepID=A0A1C7MQD6_GRIFR|nr:hypothetical protein A0H81_00901 [Grifola frondosa]
MDDSIPSISSGAVGSRFVSQTDIETAKLKRDEQWKAAYARLGQEPPPQPVEDAFDGRSLAEKLAANRAAKQEEWEERNKLGNQFRALEEDEVLFLDSIMERQREEEQRRKEMDGEELKHFREAVAARENAANKPPAAVVPEVKAAAPAKSKTPAAPAIRKDSKKSLKGVLVKKKPKAVVVAPPATSINEAVSEGKSKKGGEADDEPEHPAKRRKITDADS